MGESKNRPQVFISFRGKDERQKLLPHLKQHLKDRNVNVFTDEDATAELKSKLLKHIRRSRIVIIIFSINYLESEWCLNELVEIRKCLQTEKLDFAIPIFYKVKPSHVKKLSGKFGKKFVALEKKHRNSKVKRWKKALRYVADIVGLTYQKKSSMSELDFIKLIVEKVDFTLTKISKKNNSPATFKGESSNQTDFHHLNKMLYFQGLKDGIISSMQSSNNSFRSSHPANPLQFRGYNWGVDSRLLLSQNFAPFVQVPTCYRRLEPWVPQDYRPSISYHNNINQYHPLYIHSTLSDPQVPQDYRINFSNNSSFNFMRMAMCEDSESEDITNCNSLEFDEDDIVSTSHAAERDDKTSCISFLCNCFKRCFSLIWRAKEDDED